MYTIYIPFIYHIYIPYIYHIYTIYIYHIFTIYLPYIYTIYLPYIYIYTIYIPYINIHIYHIYTIYKYPYIPYIPCAIIPWWNTSQDAIPTDEVMPWANFLSQAGAWFGIWGIASVVLWGTPEGLAVSAVFVAYKIHISLYVYHIYMYVCICICICTCICICICISVFCVSHLPRTHQPKRLIRGVPMLVLVCFARVVFHSQWSVNQHVSIWYLLG